MYEDIPLDALVPHAENSNRIRPVLRRKLLHNIQELGMYETLTVRPHPLLDGRFEVLNGHARLGVLRELGVDTAKCEVWDVTEPQARLFLAILNTLRGTETPELRMGILLKLLEQFPREELAAHVPESVAYLERLTRLTEADEQAEPTERGEKPDVTIVEFYLTQEEHRIVSQALESVRRRAGLADSSQALVAMARLHMAQHTDTPSD
jgi:ParB-like chromosome segregation protein Spo0J